MINLNEQYPNKTAGVTANYPFGQARNVTLPGDRKGTPWDQALVNDLIGFQQAALIAAGMTPNGTPDNANFSQVLNAILQIILSKFAGSQNHFKIPNPTTPEKPWIVQFFNTSYSAANIETTFTQNFPVAFPNECKFAICSDYQAAFVNINTMGIIPSICGKTKTSIVCLWDAIASGSYPTSRSISIIAIGN